MRRFLPLLLAAIVAGCSSASGSTAAPLVDIGAGLRGPAGLAATVYATDLANVSAFAFDGDGRLWAATAAFANADSDAIYVVATAGAAPTRVIDDIHTPLGLAWVGDTLYVASAGRVDAYTDLDALAFATHTTVLTLPSDVGEVNGIVMSPDGRLVVGVSAPCDACTPTSPSSAAVISFRPDGSDLRVDASGIRAPIGLAYIPGTADLLVSMNQEDGLGDATPGDWLSIVRTGQDWGFPDCYGQGGEVCDGVPQPLAVLDKHAAVSGVAVVAGGLGSTIGTVALVAEWTTGIVMRVDLPADTSSAASTPSVATPFLTGLKQPVPVATAPDGSVVVGDWGTGTIYRIATA